MMFIIEYSPLPGTLRSYDERVEFDEPCTRNRIGSGFSPAFGAPTRLRHRLSFTPFLSAQYSWLQISASPAAAGVAPSACARLDTRLAPRPAPAVIKTIRRATPSSPSPMSLLPVAAPAVQVQARLPSS